MRRVFIARSRSAFGRWTHTTWRRRVGARDSVDIDVRLRIDPTKLPEWTLNGGLQGGNGAGLNLPEYDGYIILSAGNETLSVPWHVLPRKAAALDTTLAFGNPGPRLKLRNRGAEVGDYEVFSLIGRNGRLPRSDLPRPGDNFAIVDMRAVGVRYLPASVFGADFLEFAINTFGRRAHPNYPAEFDVYLDTTGDGVPDFVVFNAENGGFAATGQNVTFLANLKTGAAQAFFFTDADLNSGNVIMTVPMAPMALPPGRTVGIDVFAFDNYFSGALADQLTGMRFTPGQERFGVAGQPFGSVPSRGSAVVPVTLADVPSAASTERGLLMMYRRQAGREAELVQFGE